MTFDVGYALQILPIFLTGAAVTLYVTVGGMAVALVAGLVVALLRLSPISLVAHLADLFFHFMRGTPLLIQLFFVFYVLPFEGLRLPALATGVITLGLNYSAYLSEVYRTGIQGVPRHQWEAATALNLPRWRVWTAIILPQAIRPMIPAIGSLMILMFKESALVSTITIQELLNVGLTEAYRTYRYLEPLLLVGLIYLIVSYGGSLVVRRLESHYAD